MDYSAGRTLGAVSGVVLLTAILSFVISRLALGYFSLSVTGGVLLAVSALSLIQELQRRKHAELIT